MQQATITIGNMKVDNTTGAVRCPYCLITKHVSEMKLCGGFENNETGYLCEACRKLVKELGIEEI